MTRTTFTAIITFIVCLFGNCYCTMLNNLIQTYDHLFENLRFSDHIVDLKNVSRLQCVSHCSGLPTCHYVGFNKGSSECDLSNVVVWGDKGSNSSCFVWEDGWDFYQRDWECPRGLDEFSQVGWQTISLCHRRVNQSEAQHACASFGGLLEIKYLKSFGQINSYLNTMPNDTREDYFWVAGIYDDNSFAWKFPDGRIMPMSQEMADDADGSQECIAVARYSGYKYDDRRCSDRHSYICQK